MSSAVVICCEKLFSCHCMFNYQLFSGLQTWQDFSGRIKFQDCGSRYIRTRLRWGELLEVFYAVLIIALLFRSSSDLHLLKKRDSEERDLFIPRFRFQWRTEAVMSYTQGSETETGINKNKRNDCRAKEVGSKQANSHPLLPPPSEEKWSYCAVIIISHI